MAADSVTYHGPVSTPGYEVPLELMRFFTGFGVRAYNHNQVPGQEWVDSVLYKSEITNLASHLSGEQWVGAYIGNRDGNGHKLSLNLKYYPGGERKQFTAVPLFNTVNYLEQAGQPYPIFMLNDSLTVEFTRIMMWRMPISTTPPPATAAGAAATSLTRRSTPSCSTERR